MSGFNKGDKDPLVNPIPGSSDSGTPIREPIDFSGGFARPQQGTEPLGVYTPDDRSVALGEAMAAVQASAAALTAAQTLASSIQKRSSELMVNWRFFSAMDEYNAAIGATISSASAAALARSRADIWLAAVQALGSSTVSSTQKAQLAILAANYASAKASADAAAGKADVAVKAAQAAEAAAAQKPSGLFG